jgi:hypothetical protein
MPSHYARMVIYHTARQGQHDRLRFSGLGTRTRKERTYTAASVARPARRAGHRNWRPVELIQAEPQIDSGLSDRLIACWLFACFMLLYIGTAVGILRYGDDISMMHVTARMLNRGDFEVGAGTPGSNPGPDGRYYSKFGIGQSLLALPFYRVGQALEAVWPTRSTVDVTWWITGGTPVLVVSLIGILSSAGTVALLYLAGRLLGCSRWAGVWAALALGLGTFVWHYSRTFMTEPTSSFALLLAFVGLQRFARSGRSTWLWVSGAGAGWATLLRLGNVCGLLPLALWLGWETVRLRPTTTREIFLGVARWCAPIVAALVVVGAYNLVRFGDPRETGYAAEVDQFSTPLAVGVYGLLLSPGKGLFLYAPIALAGAIGWPNMLRRRPAPALAAAGLVVAFLVFYGRWYTWWGGGAWGPRFATILLPYLVLGLAPLVDRGVSRLAGLALWALGTLSVGIQVLSILVPYIPYLVELEAIPGGVDRSLWTFAASPLVAEAASLWRGDYPPDLAWTYYPYTAIAVLQGAALLGGLGALVGGLWSQAHRHLPIRRPEEGTRVEARVARLP